MIETVEYHVQQPAIRKHQTPLLFQHGAWHGAWCWQLWMDYFASLGYEVHAISLPAHGKSSCNKRHINFYTLENYVETLAGQIEAISPRPVVIGHSMGGGILQKYLENHSLPGAVFLAGIPSSGILQMGLRLFQQRPIITLAGMLTLNFHNWVKTPLLAQAMFLDPKTKVDTKVFQEQLVSESVLVSLALMFPFARVNPNKSPIFVVAGEKDALFTLDEERKTAEKYGAKYTVIKGQPHNLMMESGWQPVADEIDQWITHELALP